MIRTTFVCDNCEKDYHVVDRMCMPPPGKQHPTQIVLAIEQRGLDLCTKCEGKIIAVLSEKARARFRLASPSSSVSKGGNDG